tara:strand:- start:53 stop:598 length:546 start_codon:yes stop_codon:yes gene_type:complete
MTDYTINRSAIFGEIEYFDSQRELNNYLEKIKPYLASIIIEFNCLEDEISALLCDMYGDDNHEKIYITISEMMFKRKATTLLKLYSIENASNRFGHESEIRELDREITACGTNRNEYAHGSWLYASPSKGVSVKTKVRKNGIETVYRKFDKDIMKKHLNLITETRYHLLHFHSRFMASKCQ